jgi:hypothetical protein
VQDAQLAREQRALRRPHHAHRDIGLAHHIPGAG